MPFPPVPPNPLQIVLLCGDIHVPYRAEGVPQAFKDILVSFKHRGRGPNARPWMPPAACAPDLAVAHVRPLRSCPARCST